jgi:hypothetical protein
MYPLSHVCSVGSAYLSSMALMRVLLLLAVLAAAFPHALAAEKCVKASYNNLLRSGMTYGSGKFGFLKGSK